MASDTLSGQQQLLKQLPTVSFLIPFIGPTRPSDGTNYRRPIPLVFQPVFAWALSSNPTGNDQRDQENCNNPSNNNSDTGGGDHLLASFHNLCT